MSGVGAKIRADEVLERLKGMEVRGGNLTGVNRFFGGYMQGSIEKNFAEGGRPDHWQPLRFSTKVAWISGKKSAWTKKGRMSKKGRAAWSGRLPLTDTARLRRSIFYIAGARGVQICTNVIYAGIHQFGGMAGRGRKVYIPARPFLLFQDEDVRYYGQLLSNYLITGRVA